MGGKAATQPLPGLVALRCRSPFLRVFDLSTAAGLKGGKGAKKSSTASQSLWLASNQSKRWGEAFFLLYTPFWLTLTIGIVVPYKLYERFTELEYLLLGLVSAVPAFLIPIFVVGEADRGKCWKDRYWVKVTYLFLNLCVATLANFPLKTLQIHLHARFSMSNSIP